MVARVCDGGVAVRDTHTLNKDYARRSARELTLAGRNVRIATFPPPLLRTNGEEQATTVGSLLHVKNDYYINKYEVWCKEQGNSPPKRTLSKNEKKE